MWHIQILPFGIFWNFFLLFSICSLLNLWMWNPQIWRANCMLVLTSARGQRFSTSVEWGRNRENVEDGIEYFGDLAWKEHTLLSIHTPGQSWSYGPPRYKRVWECGLPVFLGREVSMRIWLCSTIPGRAGSWNMLLLLSHFSRVRLCVTP